MGREQKGPRAKRTPPSSFLLSPHFPRFPNTKTPSRGPMLKFGSYGNACYAGKITVFKRIKNVTLSVMKEATELK